MRIWRSSYLVLMLGLVVCFTLLPIPARGSTDHDLTLKGTIGWNDIPLCEFTDQVPSVAVYESSSDKVNDDFTFNYDAKTAHYELSGLPEGELEIGIDVSSPAATVFPSNAPNGFNVWVQRVIPSRMINAEKGNYDFDVIHVTISCILGTIH